MGPIAEKKSPCIISTKLIDYICIKEDKTLDQNVSARLKVPSKSCRLFSSVNPIISKEKVPSNEANDSNFIVFVFKEKASCHSLAWRPRAFLDESNV